MILDVQADKFSCLSRLTALTIIREPIIHSQRLLNRALLATLTDGIEAACTKDVARHKNVLIRE